ncbi:uncharacterized protein LOC133330556 [Musca vetustissima]|uniref:uncharacterized protein LOC133330556 n=1 Tax=Musca vetustissima TaxID=27455 RepID=UPI002AB6DE31|nr:uncharacterized protein LOC133330556 [Musca vetustissima]
MVFNFSPYGKSHKVHGVKDDWYPERAYSTLQKCKDQHPLPEAVLEDIDNGRMEDSPTLRQLILCASKAFNVYTTEHGYNADRLAHALYRIGMNRTCRRQVANECVTKYKDVKPEDEMAFNIIKCIIDKEVSPEVVERDGPPSEWKGCDIRA